MGRLNLAIVVIGLVVAIGGIFTHPNTVLVGMGIFLLGILVFVLRRFFGKILE